MFRPLATSALALILGAGAALANVTPAEVWESLERTYTDMGYQVEIGARDEAADALRLDNVVLRASPEAEGQFSATIPRLVLSDAGGGTVRSVLEGDVTLQSRMADEDGRASGFDAVMQLPGNETISSGTPEDMRHRYTIPELRITGTAVDAEGQAPLTMTFTQVQGDQSVRQEPAGGNSQSYDVRAAGMSLSVSGQGPTLDDEGEPATGPDAATDRFATEIRVENLAAVGTGTTPGGGADFETDQAAALRAGLNFEGRFTTGPLSGTVEFSTTPDADAPEGEASQQDDRSGSAEFSIAAAEIGFSLSQTGILFEAQTQNTDLRMDGGGTPMPLAYSVAAATGSINLPLLADEQPQPFAFTYGLEGVTLDDQMWAGFDPDNRLPRDPGSLNIDLSGEAVITRDLIDQQGQRDAEDMPILPRSLSVNRMALNALGAAAEIAGDLTFGDDPTQPVGTLTGDFTGINQLLDSMVAMGVLPQEQVMGTRMMLAMFARPVEGEPDRLRTELEFREGGAIFANGQQVQ